MTYGRLAAFGGAFIILGCSALAWAAPGRTLLDELTPGKWDLHERGSSHPGRNICLANGDQLIQLKHAGMACRRTMTQNAHDDVTVQYTCPGAGYGRTHIRRENDGLVQIDSQGIENGQPFAFVMEGRRVGACGH